MTRDDLPEPETPVIEMKHFNGSFTSICCKLLCAADLIINQSPLGSFRFSGIGIFILPERYCPVRLSSLERRFSKVPFETTVPPCLPAPGPKSTIQSACLNVSSSCSTTRRVFPISVNSLRVASNLELSLGCNPILGSSRTYITPVNLVPI